MALCVPFRYALATNSTSTSFTAKTPTATKPSGTGVHDMLDNDLGVGHGVRVPSWLQLVPYGTNGDNDTFDFRLYGWSRTKDSTPIWVPQLLLDVSVVLGNIAATAIAANTFMADTLTINDGPIDGYFRNHIDCQEDLPASVKVHTAGCQLIEFDFDLAGGQEAVSMNVLWRPVEL